MNIIQACKDELLFRNFLKFPRKDHPVYKFGSINSWRPWFTALRVLYGLPLPESSLDLIKQCTGRDPALFPEAGYRNCLWLCGRRSGKSRTAAVICAYEAVLAGHETRLSAGETGYVAVVSPTRSQSRLVHDYTREIFNSSDMLRQQVVRETQNGFDLRSGIRVEILTGSGAKLRGRTICCVVADEIAHMGYEEESRVSDSEMIAALKPALMTTKGKLVCITTPYAQKGFTYQQYKKHFGNDASQRMIVWNAPSLVMNNATLTKEEVEAEIAEDPAKAKAEFIATFREDISNFIPRETVERLVVRHRLELLPEDDQRYVAFVDMSSGTPGGDDAALSIAHRVKRTVIIDLLRRFKPPFNPLEVVGQMAADIKRFNVRRTVGDHWSPGFVAGAFQAQGVRYESSDDPKSVLYANLLPRLCSGEIELLDNEMLVNQLANLERRTRSGGRDIIDHPVGREHHDDLANVIAGVSQIAAVGRIVVGAAW